MNNILIINLHKEQLEVFRPDFSTLCCNVEDLLKNNDIPRPLYFVSPANSFLFMDAGIDLNYMHMFPGIDRIIKPRLLQEKDYLPNSDLGPFLPIGAALNTKISDDYYLISAPTMFLPQDVQNTNNAYHAMKAILKLWPNQGTLILPLLCGGIGKMKPENIKEQINKAIQEHNQSHNQNNEQSQFKIYNDTIYLPNDNIINNILDEQPQIYMNSYFRRQNKYVYY